MAHLVMNVISMDIRSGTPDGGKLLSLSQVFAQLSPLGDLVPNHLSRLGLLIK